MTAVVLFLDSTAAQLNNFSKAPHPAFEVFVSDDNIGLWKVLMQGPEHTVYEDGLFMLYISFPGQGFVQSCVFGISLRYCPKLLA